MYLFGDLVHESFHKSFHMSTNQRIFLKYFLIVSEIWID
jgi:hypothetical protein